MGINTEKNIEANLQIGPTDRGMVRIFISAGDAEIPMDFEIDEANDIAQEIIAAANAAAANLAAPGPRDGGCGAAAASTSSASRACLSSRRAAGRTPLVKRKPDSSEPRTGRTASATQTRRRSGALERAWSAYIPMAS